MKLKFETIPLPVDTTEFRKQESLANKNLLLTGFFSIIKTPGAIIPLIKMFTNFTQKKLENGEGIFKDGQRDKLGINHRMRNILLSKFPSHIKSIDRLLYDTGDLSIDKIKGKTFEEIKEHLTLSTHILNKIINIESTFERNEKAYQIALKCSKSLCNALVIDEESIKNFEEFLELLNQHKDKKGMILHRKHKGNFDSWSIAYILERIIKDNSIDISGREFEWIYGLFLATDPFAGKFGPSMHLHGVFGPKDIEDIKNRVIQDLQEIEEKTMSEEIEEKTRLKKIKESPLYKEITTAMNTINGLCKIDNTMIENIFITGGRDADDNNPASEAKTPGKRTQRQKVQSAMNGQITNTSKIYLPFSVNGLGSTMPLKRLTIEIGKFKKEIFFKIFQKTSYNAYIGKPFVGGEKKAEEINQNIYSLGEEETQEESSTPTITPDK